MTKADIVSRIIEQTGVEKATALAVVESFMEQVKNALTDGESVYLRGFGTFLIRAAKTARNISTNTTIIVPAHSMPAFKPSTEFASKIK